jgi:hypothetical protein
MHRSEDG